MSTLQGSKLQNMAAERDFTFGMKPKEAPAPKMVEEEKPVDVQTKLLPVHPRQLTIVLRSSRC